MEVRQILELAPECKYGVLRKRGPYKLDPHRQPVCKSARNGKPGEAT